MFVYESFYCIYAIYVANYRYFPLSLAEMVPSGVSECVKRDLTPQSKSFGQPKSKLKRTVGKFLIKNVSFFMSGTT